jgi:sirohydrochlorin cobaltochelatase
MLLVGHGTRDSHGADEFQQVASCVQQLLPKIDVQPAFIETLEPNIVDGVQQLVARGVDTVTVTPLLLFAAGHAKRDIPDAVSTAKRKFVQTTIKQAQHLGCHPKLLQLSAERCREAEKVRRPPNGETIVVLVGRGSSDPHTVTEMKAFAAQRQLLTPSTPITTAFVALATPSLDEVVADVRRRRIPFVVVQPHLLFSGAMVDKLRYRVATSNERETNQYWQLAQPLGPNRQVAEAVVDRFLQAQ